MELHAVVRRTLPICMAAALLSCHSGGSDPPPSQPPPPPPGSGLDQRPSNLSCVAPARVTGNSTLSVQRAFPASPSSNRSRCCRHPATARAGSSSSRTASSACSRISRTSRRARSSWTSTTACFSPARPKPACWDLAFHPNFPTTNRVYVNYSSPVADTAFDHLGVHEPGRRPDHQSQLRARLAVGQQGLRQPQRRTTGVRAQRRIPLYRTRRWRRRQRPERQRAEPPAATRQDAAHRRQFATGRRAVRDPGRRNRQSLCQQSALQCRWHRRAELPRDLRARPSQSMALELRSADRRPVARRRRPRRVRRDRSHRARRQLWLGHPRRIRMRGRRHEL